MREKPKVDTRYLREGFPTEGWYLVKRGTDSFKIIVSTGLEWDHVSLSIKKPNGKHRLPTWNEMFWLKDMFFKDSEVAIQIHPSKSDYINTHPYVLHLWRSQNIIQPLPPQHLV